MYPIEWTNTRRKYSVTIIQRLIVVGEVCGITPDMRFGLRSEHRQGGKKSVPVTFPINFPTKCISVIAVLQAPDDGGNMSKNRLCVVNISKTGFSIQNPQNTYMYIAIGI